MATMRVGEGGQPFPTRRLTRERAILATRFMPALQAEARSRQAEAGQSFGPGRFGSRDPKRNDPTTVESSRARAIAGERVGVSGPTIQRAVAVRHREGVGWPCQQVGAAPARTSPPPATRMVLDALRKLSHQHDAATAARLRSRRGLSGVSTHQEKP